MWCVPGSLATIMPDPKESVGLAQEVKIVNRKGRVWRIRLNHQILISNNRAVAMMLLRVMKPLSAREKRVPKGRAVVIKVGGIVASWLCKVGC